MSSTDTTTWVYRPLDPEYWCPTCSAHCAVLFAVYGLSSAGVQRAADYFRCSRCETWSATDVQVNLL